MHTCRYLKCHSMSDVLSTKNPDPDTPKLNTDSFWSTTVQTLNESKTSFVIGTLPFLGRVDEDESLPQYDPVDNATFPESKTSIIGEESVLGRVHEGKPGIDRKIKSGKLIIEEVSLRVVSIYTVFGLYSCPHGRFYVCSLKSRRSSYSEVFPNLIATDGRGASGSESDNACKHRRISL